MGALFTLAAEAIIPPESVREVIHATARGIGHLFGVDLPALGPGWD